MLCKEVSIQTPTPRYVRQACARTYRSQLSQRHASSNEYSHEYSAPESKPDSPNARSRSGAVTRIDPTPGDTARRPDDMCIRVDPTPGDAEQGNEPCPATLHTRGAPATGHRQHVSSDDGSTALRALPCSSSAAMAQRKCPNEAYNKDVHWSRSPAARDQCTLLYKPPAYCGRRTAPMTLIMVRGLYRMYVYIYTACGRYSDRMAHTACGIVSWVHAVAQAACHGVEERKPG